MRAEKSKTEIKTIRKSDTLFPALLREIPGVPTQIYLLGELPGADIPKLAIVGTRGATQVGRSLAKHVSQELSEAGFVIVSGLAMGIDTAAHEGALIARSKTIAVLGNGLDAIYPRQNENLAKRILEFGGAIISEYPTGTPSLPHQFLERNRIVSGLCLGTIIIEAPLESGSLVTARMSAEQGREVFVFPGAPNHPNYQGSHKLIRDGARLVTSVEDILEDLGIKDIKTQKLNVQLGNVKDKNQLLILEVIRNAGQPLRIDKIVELTRLESQIVNQSLTLLVIDNIIKETERGYTL